MTISSVTVFLAVIFGNIAGVFPDTPLRYVVGVPQDVRYQNGDASVSLRWSFSPAGATTFNFKCYHSHTFNGQKKLVIHSNMSSAQGTAGGVGQFNDRANWTIAGDSLKITIYSPRPEDEGWYFCDVNTVMDLDVTGAVKLLRESDKLESVISEDSSFNETYNRANLTWKFWPKRANVSKIICMHKAQLAFSWDTVAKFTTKDNKLDDQGQFLNRIGSIFKKQDGIFILTLRELSLNDQGIFDCKFTGKDSPEVSSKLHLSYTIKTELPDLTTIPSGIYLKDNDTQTGAKNWVEPNCTLLKVLLAVFVPVFIICTILISLTIYKCKRSHPKGKKNIETVVQDNAANDNGKNMEESKRLLDAHEGGGIVTQPQQVENQATVATSDAQRCQEHLHAQEDVTTPTPEVENQAPVSSADAPRFQVNTESTGSQDHNMRPHTTGTQMNMSNCQTVQYSHITGHPTTLAASTSNNTQPGEPGNENGASRNVSEIVESLPDDGKLVYLREKGKKEQSQEKKASHLNSSEELTNLLQELELDDFEEVFCANNMIKPTEFHKYSDAVFESMGIHTIGDIIHLKNNKQWRRNQKLPVAPDVAKLLTALDCQKYIGQFIAEKIGADDFRYLTVEHLDKLEVYDDDARENILKTNRGSTVWKQMQRSTSRKGSIEQNLVSELGSWLKNKNDIQTGTPTETDIAENIRLPAVREARRQSQKPTLIETSTDSKLSNGCDKTATTYTLSALSSGTSSTKVDTDICYQALNAKYKEIMGTGEVKDASQIGAVLLLKEKPEVICMVSGTGISEQCRHCAHTLLQKCFSRFVFEEIKTNKDDFIKNTPEDGHELNANIFVYLSVPLSMPMCSRSKSTEENQQVETPACFQHISEWQRCGFQGALVSHIMSLLYISTLQFNGACHIECIKKIIPIENNDQAKLQVKNYERGEKRATGAACSGEFRYWYKDKESANTVKLEITVSNGTSSVEREIEIEDGILIQILKEIKPTLADMTDEQLLRGSEEYQNAMKG